VAAELFANDVTTTLATTITSATTNISLASAAGLPTFTAGDTMRVRIEPAIPTGVYEIMLATALTGTTLTVTRGQEGTTAAAWTAGANISFVVTAATLTGLAAAAVSSTLFVTQFGASTGTDDTTALNAALASAGGKVLRGKPGENYLISAPLVIKSGTVLDMTGCTVTLKASSNCNMVQNFAAANPQRTSTGSITAASSTLTLASAVAGDVGRSVIVPGAGLNSTNLIATVTAVSAGVSVTLSSPAAVTASGASVALYDRDRSIALRGGLWDRGANGGTNNASHSIFMRRVDNLLIEDVQGASTNGKYLIGIGDVTAYTVRDIGGKALNSDTVHVTGPAFDGMVENIEVTAAGDDLVSACTSEFTGFDDVHGNIDNLTIRNIGGASTTRMVLLASSATGVSDGFMVQNVTVERVVQRGTGNGVYLGAQVAATTMTHDGITIRGVTGGSSASTLVYLRAPYMGQVVVEDVVAPPGQRAVEVTPEASPQVANKIDRLTMRNCRASSSTAGTDIFEAFNSITVIGQLDMYDCSSSAPRFAGFGCGSVTSARFHGCEMTTSLDPVVVNGTGMTISHMVFNGLRGNLPNTGTHYVTVGVGTVDHIEFNNPRVTAVDNNSGELVFMSATSVVVSKVTVNGGRLDATRGVIEHKASGTGVVAYVNVSDTHFNACNRIVQAGAATLNIAYSNITQASPVNAPIFVSGGALFIRGSGWQTSGSGPALQRGASEVCHVIAQDFPADADMLTGANGDTFSNTKSTVTPFVLGPCVRDAGNTFWRPEQGFMASGTATLVAGTVTVANTKITSTSVIRVHTRTPGGTQGAVFISALTAGTSFTIKSTSASDTSVIYYEVVTF
jgi:hypothetical protein